MSFAVHYSAGHAMLVKVENCRLFPFLLIQGICTVLRIPCMRFEPNRVADFMDFL